MFDQGKPFFKNYGLPPYLLQPSPICIAVDQWHTPPHTTDIYRSWGKPILLHSILVVSSSLITSLNIIITLTVHGKNQAKKPREASDKTSEKIAFNQVLQSSNKWFSNFASCGIEVYVSSQFPIALPPAEAEEDLGEKQTSQPHQSSQDYQAYQTFDQFLEAPKQLQLDCTSSTSSRSTKGATFRETGMHIVQWPKDCTWKGVSILVDVAFMNKKEERLYQKAAWYVNPEYPAWNSSTTSCSSSHAILIYYFPRQKKWPLQFELKQGPGGLVS